jgi:hypothetical protein
MLNPMDALIDEAEEARLLALEALNLLDTAPEERFDRVTRLSTRLFGVPMAAVALVSRDRWMAKSRQGLTVGDIERADSFCEFTIRQPDILVIEDTHQDERFRANPLVLGDPHIRFYAGQPLEAPGGHRVGTLCILDSTPRKLTEADRSLLRDLATWVQKEMSIDEELERAADVQRGLLPQAVPQVPGYDLAGRCLPSRQVGGDLFDWYAMPDGMAFTVADVMGKGMPAAIVMATLRAVLRAGTRQTDLAGAVGMAAATMEADFPGGVFATLFHARLDGAAGTLTYVDAGHGLARIVRAGGALEALDVRGLPAGAMPGSTWPEGKAQLAPGDGLVVFSDGVLDLHPDQGAVDAELAAAMAAGATADEVADRLVAPARGAYREDDVTVVVVRRTD